MTFTRAVTATASILICAWVGCGRGGDVKPEAVPNTDVAALARLINLSAVPQSVQWETVQLGSTGGFGPDDWALVATLRYDEPTATELVDHSHERSETSGIRIPANLVRGWFPQSLRNQ